VDVNPQRTANNLANELSSLLIKRETASYDIGRIIDQVYTNKLWQHWPGGGFATATSWSWEVLHCKERKAQYLRANFLKLSALDVSENTKTRALRIGWSKLTLVLDMASSEVELIDWIDRVEEEKLREVDLRRFVSMYRAGLITNAHDKPEEQEPETYNDDDRDNTSPDADYDRSEQDKTKRMIWKLTFTDPSDMKVFVDALEVIRNRLHPGMGLGKAAALMATSYLANCPRSDEGGPVVEADYMLKAVERNWGISLEVVNDKPADAPAAHTGSFDPSQF